MPYGNRIDSEWMTATMSFSSKSGTTPVVALANCTELRAQEGTLQIIGTWSVTDLVYSITPV